MNDEYNASYVPGGNGEVIFLMLGGEGPGSPDFFFNTKMALMWYAKQYGAVVYVLEHRYYGQSWPTA